MKKVLAIILFFIFGILDFPLFVLALDRVEINTASLEQLDEIIGIGPALAQRIIDTRPFSSVNDLIRVKGIGEKTLQKIKDQGLAYVKNGAEASEPAITEETTAIEPTEDKPAGVEPPQTYPTGVVINEILPSPEGPDEENEWIELYNTNNFEVDLSGWKIKDTTGTTTTFIIPKYLPDGRQAKISAYGYLILKRPDTKITLNNTTDGLSLYWPNEKIVDSMVYEKAPINQSYNKIGKNWQWSVSLTPGAKNTIAQNNTEKGAESLPKIEKSGNSKEIGKSLAAISQPTNPWFLFLIAIIITIISAIIVLILKIRVKPKS